MQSQQLVTDYPPVRTRNVPPAVHSLMNQVEARAGNLGVIDRKRAEGIIRYIRDHDRATENQVREIQRLAKVSEKKRRVRLAKPKPPERRADESPEEFYHRRMKYLMGVDWSRTWSGNLKDPSISAAQNRKHAYSAARHDLLMETDPEYAAAQRRAQARRDALHEVLRASFGKAPREYDRERLRVLINHYWPADHLPSALPEIIQPHMKPRREIIACLIRRLRTLRAEPMSSYPTERAAAQGRIMDARAALIAEGIALLRDRQTVRNFQNDEAA